MGYLSARSGLRRLSDGKGGGVAALGARVRLEPAVYENLSNLASHAINLPTAPAGSLLVAFARLGGTGSRTASISGWTSLASNAATNVLYKVSNGSEGATATMTLDTLRTAHAFVICIEDADASAIQVSGEIGSGVTINTPTLTPAWGEADNLWLMLHYSGSTNNGIRDLPNDWSCLARPLSAHFFAEWRRATASGIPSASFGFAISVSLSRAIAIRSL